MKKIALVGLVVIALIAFVVYEKKGSSSTVAAGSYKDGTYDGSVADAGTYGNLQVKATVAGGKITDVEYLQYPTTPQHSIDVNQGALPTFKQEVIAAQNANIDTVSGATQSSEAFRQSLQAALQQAT